MQVYLHIAKNMDSMAKKPQKFHKIYCISVCAFCSISIINIATPPTFFNIFTSNFEINFSTKSGSNFIDRIFKFRIWRHFPENCAKMAPELLGQPLSRNNIC